MNLRELRPNLWLTELVLDVFDVRGAVIVGEKSVVVWDTLSHPRDMQGVTELAKGKPIYVVYSHADWDHCWGTAALEYDLIIAHEACGKRFEVGEVAESLARMQAEEPGTYDGVKLIPPVMTFADKLTLDLGGVTVELHHLAGHTEDCLVAFIPEWGVLLAGDTVETPLPYLHENSIPVLPRWISELERWNNDGRVQSVVPSHGRLGDRSLIAHNIRYLSDLWDGKPSDVPAEMTSFYAGTHAKNVELTQGGNQ